MSNGIRDFIVAFAGVALLGGCSQVRLEGALPDPETISINAKAYCPTDGFSLTEVFAFNSSAILEGASYIPDFDRDGLPDKFEMNPENMNKFNINYKAADFNGDGYSDFVAVMVMGFDQNNQRRLAACPDKKLDTDRDGLTDCEEAAARTNYLNPDSDFDGVPDGIEVRFGLNPLDAMDSLSDIDQDGLNALQEIKINTPHNFTNTEAINKRRFLYSLNSFTKTENQECHDIMIENIPVIQVSNGNLIHILVLEKKVIQGQGEIRRVARTRVLVPRQALDHSVISFDGIKDVVIDGRTGEPYFTVGGDL